MGLNHIDIQGIIVRDPEMRRTNSGKAVTSFTIAVDRNFSKGESDFIDCVSWDKQGEFVSNNFSKGKMILVSGRLQIRKWEDKNGNKQKTAEIVTEDVYFCDSKKEEKTENPFQGNASSFELLDGNDSNLPF
jgi:single-strand DNA-binding protein